MRLKPSCVSTFRRGSDASSFLVALSRKLALVLIINMRPIALIVTLLIAFTFAIPAQAAEACECLPTDELSHQDCCQMPVDCCLETAIPGHSFDWLWERSNPNVTPQLIVLAILEPIDTLDLPSLTTIFRHERPPPRGARTLRSFQQSWLI